MLFCWQFIPLDRDSEPSIHSQLCRIVVLIIMQMATWPPNKYKHICIGSIMYRVKSNIMSQGKDDIRNGQMGARDPAAGDCYSN